SHIVYISIHSILSHFAIPCLKLLTKEVAKPTKTTRRCAQTATRQGKPPATQAGEYVREEMRKTKKERKGVKSRTQAVAIGLSKARQDGVKLRIKSRIV
ncbi:MAG: DUF6496 domain-containing protein, partial [Nitrospirota bacterium]